MIKFQDATWLSLCVDEGEDLCCRLDGDLFDCVCMVKTMGACMKKGRYHGCVRRVNYGGMYDRVTHQGCVRMLRKAKTCAATLMEICITMERIGATLVRLSWGGSRAISEYASVRPSATQRSSIFFYIHFCVINRGVILYLVTGTCT